MRNIAIIPARSGSKGLENKNIKLLDGKPLIAYTIEAAIESNEFEEICVSTDSEEYALIAREWGANVPFLRTEELSSDTASSWDVVKNVLISYAENNILFDTVALLQPTSPLRSPNDIIEGYKQMSEKEANAVVSVCEIEHSPLWSNTLPKDNSLHNFLKGDLLDKPRQELPTYYRINGALYIVNIDYLMSTENIYKEKCYASIMSKENSIDIDDALDFRLAELMLQLRKE